VRATIGHGSLGTVSFRAGSARSRHGRVVLGHTAEHVGWHGPTRSINWLCLARHYLDRAESGSGRARVRWPVWTSIAIAMTFPPFSPSGFRNNSGQWPSSFFVKQVAAQVMSMALFKTNLFIVQNGNVLQSNKNWQTTKMVPCCTKHRN
jgi:hypothetical protein